MHPPAYAIGKAGQQQRGLRCGLPPGDPAGARGEGRAVSIEAIPTAGGGRGSHVPGGRVNRAAGSAPQKKYGNPPSALGILAHFWALFGGPEFCSLAVIGPKSGRSRKRVLSRQSGVLWAGRRPPSFWVQFNLMGSQDMFFGDVMSVLLW